MIDTRAKEITVFWAVGFVYAIYSTGPFINLFFVFKSLFQSGLMDNIVPLLCTLISFAQTILFMMAGSYALFQKLYVGEILEAIERGIGLLWIQDIDDYLWQYFNYQDKYNDGKEVTRKQVLQGSAFVFLVTCFALSLSFLLDQNTKIDIGFLNLGS